MQLEDVQGATEAGLGVGNDGDQPVIDGGVALDARHLVGTKKCIVDAAHDLRNRVSGVQGLVGVGLSSQVGVARNLPTGQVHGLQPSANLLDSLVTGESAEGVDVAVALFVDGVKKDFGAAPGEGVFLDDGALERFDILRRVVAGDPLPARVGFPILLDFFSGTGLSNRRHCAHSYEV